MWHQDDWYSCEDLTMDQTECPSSGRGGNDTSRLGHPCRPSSYPVGCVPEKLLREEKRRGENKRNNGAPNITISLLFDSIKDKRQRCLKAVSRLFVGAKPTTQKGRSLDTSSLQEFGLGRSASHTVIAQPVSDPSIENQGVVSHERTCHNVEASNQRFLQKNKFKDNLTLLTNAINRRVSLHTGFPQPQLQHSTRGRPENEIWENVSISAKSSISLPRINPLEEELDTSKRRNSNEFLLPLSIPSLETMMLAYSFQSDDQTD